MTLMLTLAPNSELAPHSALLLTELLPRYIDNSCFRIVNGAVKEVTALLQHPYGHILYTGAGPVGRIVMAAAAKYLTPVTLELGGKSPVIVTAKADVALAAKRIAWGKFFNAGQTCMCPDYALVEEGVMPEFLEQLKLVSPCPLSFRSKQIGAHLTGLDLYLKLTLVLEHREDIRLRPVC